MTRQLVSLHWEGRYAFIELRTPEMATASLQLGNQAHTACFLDLEVLRWVMSAVLHWLSTAQYQESMLVRPILCCGALLAVPQLHSKKT